MSGKKMKRKKSDEGPFKAALYIRVSTDAQFEEGYSVPAQQERLAAYAKAIGIDDVEYYIDGGFSGSSLDRPEMKRLIADAKKSKITHVIVYKLDRISRSQKDTLYLIEDVFNTHNVAFVSINESFDTSTAFGRAVVGILSVFAQLERENIYERTRMGMQKRVESGLWMGGGRVPYGYDYDQENGVLVPNEDAENVRRIYDLYLQGYSMQRISDMLGLKYERLAQQILMRKSNAGYIVYNGVEYKGKHQPIVSEETYEKAMLMLKTRSSKRLISATNHLLTGLVYCGKCGAKMRYQKWGKKGYRLVCYSQQRSKAYLIKDENCDNERPWAEEIENAVLGVIFSLSVEIAEGETDTPDVQETMQKQYDALAGKIKRLYNLYAASGDELLLETIGENNAALGKLAERLREEAEKSTYSKAVFLAKEKLKSLSDLWDYMTVQERQNALRAAVSRVVVTGEEAEVRLNF